MSKRVVKAKKNRNSFEKKQSVLEQKRLRQVPGLHSVNELLAIRPQKVEELWVREFWGKSHELTALCEKAKKYKIKIVEKSTGALDRICKSHQGICAFTSETPSWDIDELKLLGEDEPYILLYLDRIVDPNNLGAILRTAWLMGVKAVFIPKHQSVSLTPAAVKVACGGAEHTPVVEVDGGVTWIEDLKKFGFWIYGLDADAKSSIWGLKLSEKILWVVGAEEKGVRSTIQKQCDELGFIPQSQKGASYNASVAAAIALSESCRQNDVREALRSKDV